MTRKKRSRTVQIILLAFLLIMVIGGWMGYGIYKKIFLPNVKTESDSSYLFIPTNADFEEIKKILNETDILKSTEMFVWVAKKKNYPNQIKPGRYLIQSGMNNNAIVNMLRSGSQTPLDIQLDNIRTKKELAGTVAEQLECDSVEIYNLLNNSNLHDNYSLNKDNILTLFIADTYKFNWNTSPEEFVERMAKEYHLFWNEDRKAKAAQIGLKPWETAVMASIVEKETAKSEEKAKIAGVYMNRLKKDMKLQADPTLIWAAGDFSVRRVLNKHKEIDSPYNTYMYKGLPPGPIILPSKVYMDAVLNYEKHDYIFFVAKADFSGYSEFSKTLSQHEKHAEKYRKALNNRNITQ